MAIKDSSMRGRISTNKGRQVLEGHLEGPRVAGNRVFSLVKELIQTMDFRQSDNLIVKIRNKLTSWARKRLPSVGCTTQTTRGK